MPEVKFNLGGVLKIIIEEPETPVAGCMVTVSYDGFSVTARGEDMSYKLPNSKTIKVKVAYIDANENPAVVDGDVVWGSSDESIAKVQVDDADTTSAIIIASDTTGLVQITATADADLGEGVRELITIMDVEVLPGEAVAGTISPDGVPEDIVASPTKV